MKQKLLGLVSAGRAREEADLVPHVDDSPPAEAGRWTAKDQLAHLTAWRQVAAGELEAGRTGGTPPVVGTDDDGDNEKIYEQTHTMPAASIIASGRQSWDELARAIDACSEELLAGPRQRRPEQKLWVTVPNNAYFHLAEHLGYWHTDIGDPTGAEATARWGYELMTSADPDDRQRGIAAYNLGCFYAVRSRGDEALPFLREGLSLRPDLLEWARTDKDLDPIRGHAELVSLLA